MWYKSLAPETSLSVDFNNRCQEVVNNRTVMAGSALSRATVVIQVVSAYPRQK